jgi:hypothetical protein
MGNDCQSRRGNNDEEGILFPAATLRTRYIHSLWLLLSAARALLYESHIFFDSD